MDKIFKEKRMAAVTNSMPGNVDTSLWFNHLSKRGLDRKEDSKSIMNRAKSKDSWFCIHPFAEMFIELDGSYKACCLANKSNEHHISNTSIKDWMQSDNLNKLREQMLDPSKGTDAIIKNCSRCVDDEKRYGKSRRTHHMYRESNNKDRWDRIERNVRMFEKTGVWDFDERIMQIQLKSFGIECNLDCHMCNHDSSSMRIDMMNKHNVYSEKMFGSMERTQKKIKQVEDNLNKIDRKSVVEQIKELVPYLNSIKIIGGEPLIMKKYFDFLNEILKTGHAEHIKVKFQTNLTKLGEGNHKFLKFVPHFKQTSFTASIDGVGKYAEYLRRRSIWSEIEDNINLLNSEKYKGKAHVDVNSVVTCFSVLRFDEVIRYCRDNPGIRAAGWLMIERPKSLRVHNLPRKLKDQLIPKYEGWPDIQSALRMDEEPGNDFQDTLNYMLKQDKAYIGTKWESHLFDVFPELKEYYES